MIQSSTIELSISPDYVKDWSELEAIRELIQNAIDSEDSKISYNEGSIVISNIGTLTRETILLGNSSKSGDDTKIGKFGEGYKIALLVLCRLGYKPYIKIWREDSSLEIWRPFIEHSTNFNSDVLKFKIIHDPNKSLSPDCNKVIFVVPNISHNLYCLLVANNLQMREEYPENITTPQGKILLEESEKGRIYVNGLFICTNHQISYGYDIKPKYLTIDRDRRLVSDFDLLWVTSSMWSSYKNSEKESLTIQNILKGIPDVKYVKENCNENTNTLASKVYISIKDSNKGEEIFVVKDQEGYDTIKNYGHKVDKIKYVPENVYNLVVNSPNYIKPENIKKDKYRKNSNPKTIITQIYIKWADRGADMEILDDLDLLIDMASNWRNKSKNNIEEVDSNLPF